VKTPFFQNLFLEKVNKYQRLPINTISNFVEFRLDVLLLKTNFVKSLYHSRWLISSGFVFINNAVCRAISYRVSIGDNVRIKKFFFLRKYFFSISSFNLPSEFLEINYDLLSFVIITVPGFFTKQLIAKQYSFFFSLQNITNFMKT
jgi:ribosomal protein S4